MECFGRTWGHRPKNLLAVFTVHSIAQLLHTLKSIHPSINLFLSPPKPFRRMESHLAHGPVVFHRKLLAAPSSLEPVPVQ